MIPLSHLSIAPSSQMDRQQQLSTPKVDQDPYNLTPSQAQTTYYADSMADGQSSKVDEDAQTRRSTYTYRSEADISKFIRQVHGRTINALSDQYLLPTDDEEWNRLNKQHTSVILGFSGRLYPVPETVNAILRPDGHGPKRILDLGTGTGVWAVEMAHEFPHAEVVGVDLAPCPLQPDEVPSNCRFEVDDINLGLQHFENQFDVIHIRFVAAGIKDFRKTMEDVHNCLKPGGIVLWVEIDYDLYSYTHGDFRHLTMASELNPDGAWLPRPAYEMVRSVIIGGSQIDVMAQLLDTEGLWNQTTLLDPDTCKAASMYLPLGPWATSKNPIEAQYLHYVGSLMRQDIKSGHRAVHPLLIRTGWTQEVVNKWSAEADKELDSMKDKALLRIRIAWGRRRAEPDCPAPPLPEAELSTEGSLAKYPFYYVYDTQEQTLNETKERNRDKPTTEPFHPKRAKPAA